MATIGHIDKEKHAAKALELLNARREEYVTYALDLMKDNMSPGMAAERLEKKVCSEMENFLFDYLKECGAVRGVYRHQYYPVTGYYRTVRRGPYKKDVPSDLLEIKVVLPNYEEVIGDMMVEAEKRWMVDQIETITRGAQEKNKADKDIEI